METAIRLQTSAVTPISEEQVATLVGKIVHSPNNMLRITNPDGTSEQANAWFAGLVVGYEKGVFGMDTETMTLLETPEVYLSVLLADGRVYPLSPNDLEIIEITEEQFHEMVEAERLKQEVAAITDIGQTDSNIVMFPKQNIILPDEVK